MKKLFIPLTLAITLITSCSGSQAAINETWTLVELLTKSERVDNITEVIEVRNCNTVERKTVACSAGTSNELAVSLSGEGTFGEVFQGTIGAGVSSSLGLGRESGESLDLDAPPSGFIYRYTVSKEFRVFTGQVLARSSTGREREAKYAFHAHCSLRIESREQEPCSADKSLTSISPTATSQPAPSPILASPTPAPGDVLLTEYFSDQDSNLRWNFCEEEYCDFSIVGDKMVAIGSDPDAFYWTSLVDSYPEFDLQVEATVLESHKNAQFGVVFALKSSDDNFTGCLIQGNNFAHCIERRDGNVEHGDCVGVDVFSDGRVNIIRVIVIDKQWAMYANDQCVGSGENDIVRPGRIGLVVGTMDGISKVGYDNLVFFQELNDG